ncbi:hypothetical protein AHMF7605_11085 [Adhaeribacter arboris]|uniref:Uncharacterized protein n=1 Tax=Adhaeribacter arboris TaxID=2072846 RepID=A0A2T2YET4_9BACT|nr:hypothetical protein AHMF7605_11085 [Adhaeribacter arboris]
MQGLTILCLSGASGGRGPLTLCQGKKNNSRGNETTQAIVKTKATAMPTDILFYPLLQLKDNV